MWKTIAFVTIIAVLMSGCTIKMSRTVVEFDGSKTDYSQLGSMKSGKACIKRVLGFPTALDGSVSTAAKNGKISKVMHVDQTFNKGPLNLTETNCTVVYGK